MKNIELKNKFRIPYTTEGDKRRKSWNYLNETNDVLKKLNNPNIIFDLGSNIFDHSVYFGLVFPNAKIYSFEPIKNYYEMGLKNIEHFNVKNVFPMNIGVGDKIEKIDILIANEGSTLKYNDNSEGHVEKISVKTIDSLVKAKKIPAPTFMKIDVEGFELEALKGSQETVKKHKPSIWLEYHPHTVENVEYVISTLEYITKLDYVTVHQSRRIEYLLVHKSVANANDIIPYSKVLKNLNDCFYGSGLKKIRKIYDKATSRSDVKKQRIEYKLLRAKLLNGGYKPKFAEWLFWSKLYRIFTIKSLRN